MIHLLIYLYTILSVCFFFFWADRSTFRQYYSSLLSISYLRFLEQYILVYNLKVWEYHHLPFTKIIGVPILLDITLYPMIAYLIIHYRLKSMGTNCFIWATAITAIEFTLVLTGMLEHQKYWNFIYSYFLAVVIVMIIQLQYQLFLRTGWYQTSHANK